MLKRFLAVLICIAFFISFTTWNYAADGNMDGDGGDLGSGTGQSYWNPGNDGVRVTVVNKNTYQISGTPFDWTKASPPSSIISFSKRNKIQYQRGASLAPIVGGYQYHPAPNGLPNIISSNGSSNIAAVKNYFTDEGRIRAISEDANISFETLVSGEFIIMLEPIAYFTFDGGNYAMTATEAALYDRLVGGNLRAAMGLLTHQNLPLSMYLEYTELDIPPWSGGSGVISNENIIAYLGVGTVRFDDFDGSQPSGGSSIPGGEEETVDYTYYTNTDVISSIWVHNKSGSDITPDNAGVIKFKIPGQSTISKDFVIPAGESQLMWVEWHTPDDPTTLTIEVEVVKGRVDKKTIRVKVVDLVENTPPNPEGRDRNDTFTLKAHPAEAQNNTNTWGEWWAWWKEDWIKDYKVIQNPDGTTKREYFWVDKGRWEFDWKSYSATLSATAKIFPDSRVPTATQLYGQYTMKSGYGINAQVDVKVTNTTGSTVTPVQHVIATFPEFDYKTYNRFLQLERSAGGIDYWGFKPNEYSQVTNPVHFTPIWYPDGAKFPVAFEIISVWTPAGSLSTTVIADDVTIQGNVYDDWHVSPGF